MRNRLRKTLAVLMCLSAAAVVGAAAASPSQNVRVALTRRGPIIAGPRIWHPGAIRIAARSHLDDQEVNLLHFRPGYTYGDFLADGRKAQGHTPAARAAVESIYANTIFDGGVNLFRGQSATFTVKLEAGTYYLGEMTQRPQLTPIRVAGSPSTASGQSTATIAAGDRGYRVSGALPAHGTITIANAGRWPHRLNLIPVKAGTTRAQVLAYFTSTGGREDAAPPAFARKGPQLGTADLSPGRQMELSYALPVGTYAAVDLDHDIRTGRPNALAGVVAVVTLR